MHRTSLSASLLQVSRFLTPFDLYPHNGTTRPVATAFWVVLAPPNHKRYNGSLMVRETTPPRHRSLYLVKAKVSIRNRLSCAPE